MKQSIPSLVGSFIVILILFNNIALACAPELVFGKRFYYESFEYTPSKDLIFLHSYYPRHLAIAYLLGKNKKIEVSCETRESLSTKEVDYEALWNELRSKVILRAIKMGLNNKIKLPSISNEKKCRFNENYPNIYPDAYRNAYETLSYLLKTYQIDNKIPTNPSFINKLFILLADLLNKIKSVFKKDNFSKSDEASKLSYILEWIKGQDEVFNACNPPSQLNTEYPLLIRKLRDYQIASYFFYKNNFQEALKRFILISKDKDHPAYLSSLLVIPRVYVRKAFEELGNGYENNPARLVDHIEYFDLCSRNSDWDCGPDPVSEKNKLKNKIKNFVNNLRESEKLLKDIIRNRELSKIHKDAYDYLMNHIYFRIEPALFLSNIENNLFSVDKICLDKIPGKYFQIIQVPFNLPRPIYNWISYMPWNPIFYDDEKYFGVAIEFTYEAEDFWDIKKKSSGYYKEEYKKYKEEERLNKEKTEFIKSLIKQNKLPDMASWILTFHYGDEGWFDIAYSRYLKDKSITWLLAAIKTAPSSEDTSEIIQKSLEVSPDHPLYSTIKFYRAILYYKLKKLDLAEKEIDELIAKFGRNNLLADLKLIIKIKNYEDNRDYYKHIKELFDIEIKNAEIENGFLSPFLLAELDKLSSSEYYKIFNQIILPSTITQEKVLSAFEPYTLHRFIRAYLNQNEYDLTLMSKILIKLIKDKEGKNVLSRLANSTSKNQKYFLATLYSLLWPQGNPAFYQPWLPFLYNNNYIIYDLHFFKNILKVDVDFINVPIINNPSNVSYIEYYKSIYNWFEENPNDDLIPYALHLLVMGTKYRVYDGYEDERKFEVSKKAFLLLHEKYPESPWAKKTPYYY